MRQVLEESRGAVVEEHEGDAGEGRGENDGGNSEVPGRAPSARWMRNGT